MIAKYKKYWDVILVLYCQQYDYSINIFAFSYYKPLPLHDSGPKGKPSNFTLPTLDSYTILLVFIHLLELIGYDNDVIEFILSQYLLLNIRIISSKGLIQLPHVTTFQHAFSVYSFKDICLM